MSARAGQAAAARKWYTRRVSRFLAGFVTASVLWGAGIALFASGVLEPSEPEPVAAAPPDGGVGDAEEIEPNRRRRRGRRARAGSEGSEPYPTGSALTGDDLGGNDPRALDMEGGGAEEQLASAEIEQAMDQAFPRIRRCLVLAAGDAPVTGRLTFGLRIEPTGRISRVNLNGPAALTTGEAGSCLRGAAQQIRSQARRA